MSDKIIIGSHAAKYYFPDFPRTPKDLDYLCRTQEIKDSFVSSREFDYSYYGPSSAVIVEKSNGLYAEPEVLYAQKAAQFGFDSVWYDKTAHDILFFQRKGLQLNNEWYNLLFADFLAFYGPKWATLTNKDSKSFFEDAVKRKYNHDSIHEAVAHYKEPLYFRILKNPSSSSVTCSKNKFAALDWEDRIKLVKEEVFVTALERFLVPQDFKTSFNRAYAISLKKLITTMSSASGGGWFKKFMIENYQYLYK